MSALSVLKPSNDLALVSAAAGGDTAAFGELYSRYVRLVHGVLLARVPATEVDDLVQDVFITAMRRLCDLRDASRFGPWVTAIARNRANDFHRRTPPEVELTDDLAEANRGPLPADGAAILEVIRQLPEAYRETLILRLVEGMTGPEIAAHTGLSEGGVRVNLCRGMEQLRKRLTEIGLVP